jgi:malate synthase
MFAATDFPAYAGHMVRAALETGPAIPPGEMASAGFAKDYVSHHLQTLFASGFKNKAQVLESSSQTLEGANATLVHSPTEAVLKALDFHRSLEADLAKTPAQPAGTLSLPLAEKNPGQHELQQQLSSICRVILNVTSAFVDAGFGTADEANLSTLRLARQLIINWLRHKLITDDKVKAALQHAALDIDNRNQGVPDYKPFAPFDGQAYLAASELIFAQDLPMYREIETILFPARRAAKEQQTSKSTNRFESLKGAAAGLEKGESFGRAD